MDVPHAGLEERYRELLQAAVGAESAVVKGDGRVGADARRLADQIRSDGRRVPPTRRVVDNDDSTGPQSAAEDLCERLVHRDEGIRLMAPPSFRAGEHGLCPPRPKRIATA